jgi:hypothetical protein
MANTLIAASRLGTQGTVGRIGLIVNDEETAVEIFHVMFVFIA